MVCRSSPDSEHFSSMPPNYRHMPSNYNPMLAHSEPMPMMHGAPMLPVNHGGPMPGYDQKGGLPSVYSRSERGDFILHDFCCVPFNPNSIGVKHITNN